MPFLGGLEACSTCMAENKYSSLRLSLFLVASETTHCLREKKTTVQNCVLTVNYSCFNSIRVQMFGGNSGISGELPPHPMNETLMQHCAMYRFPQ